MSAVNELPEDCGLSRVGELRCHCLLMCDMLGHRLFVFEFTGFSVRYVMPEDTPFRIVGI